MAHIMEKLRVYIMAVKLKFIEIQIVCLLTHAEDIPTAVYSDQQKRRNQVETVSFACN